MVILSFFSFLGNPSEWWLHKGVVCHEDFSDPQHSHHHGVVLEAHHADDTPTRPPGKVRPVVMMIRRRIMLIMMILVIARFKKRLNSTSQSLYNANHLYSFLNIMSHQCKPAALKLIIPHNKLCTNTHAYNKVITNANKITFSTNIIHV